MNLVLKRIWGGATAVLDISRQVRWFDLVLLAGVVGLVLGLIRMAGEVTGPARTAIAIDLSPWALPKYTFFSLVRGIVAFAFSLGFTLVYGYWAAKSRVAERILVPLLDILQSIPVLGFMPGLVLALIALFPRTNFGLELAAVLMIFTGQAWNMTFSFYHSLRSVPNDLVESATVYRFGWWNRLRWVELPFATIGLVWNGMMSMAGGWFFLMVSEAFVLGEKDFRLPGVGAYMSVAVNHGDSVAMLWAICAMMTMILFLDQIVWRPLVVWSQRFRMEESADQTMPTSWLAEWLHGSSLVRLLHALRLLLSTRMARRRRSGSDETRVAVSRSFVQRLTSAVVFALLFVGLTFGLIKVLHLLAALNARMWAMILLRSFLTLGRVLLALAIGTLWALPLGWVIGGSPTIARRAQPIVQVLASFPAPMLFPLVIGALAYLGVSVEVSSIALMLLGTQWYILFNVIAGATAIPSDLREVARTYQIRGWQRVRMLHLPVIFPYLVTGWVTAAGGAWNASIVSEYVTYKGEVLAASGLGATISQAAAAGNFSLLAGSVVVMAVTVVSFNRLVWRRCYELAEARYTLS